MLRDEAVESEVLLFAHKDCRLVYEPFGVVLVITPWNYPFFISLSAWPPRWPRGTPWS